jgi:putative transposase
MGIVARQRRIPGQGIPHHITKRGHNRELICRRPSDFVKLRQLMREGCNQFELRVHAYVLMDNHFHLLATPSQEGTLSKVMKWVTGTYTQWFNFKYRQTGTLWEGRFWASQVDSEEYFFRCSFYIELNPVRAGIVARPETYPWSSYPHNSGQAHDSLVTEHDRYLQLGPTGTQRRAAYRGLVVAGVDPETVTYIREATRSVRTISAPGFLRWHEKQSPECAKS